jgi:hypothetical protein
MAGSIFQEAEDTANPFVTGKKVIGECVSIKAAKTCGVSYP